MRESEVALFVHLLGVVLLAAGSGAAAVGLERARRRDDPGEVAALLGVARAGVALVALGTATVIAGGVWLIAIGPYDFGDGWLSASLGLLVVSAALGAVGGRRPKQARLHAERLARDHAPADPLLRQLLNDRVALVLNYLSALVLIGVLALMIAKP